MLRSRRHSWARLTCAAALWLILSASPAAAGETWDGGGSNDNWTTGANWDPSVSFQFPPPNNGTANIVMPAMGGLVQTPIVNVPYSINSLTFANGDGRFVVLADQELTIGAGGITNNDADIQSVIGPVKLSANQTWTATAGRLQMDALNLNGFNLNFAGAQQIDLGSLIAGTGNLTVADAYTSTVTMVGGVNNTYAGLTDVEGGTLVLQQTNGGVARVAVPGDLTIGAGGTVRLAANEQIAETAGNEVTVLAGGLLDVNTRTETVAKLVLNGGAATSTGAGRLITNDAFVTGATASWTNDSDLYVGDTASGTLDISAGGDVSNADSFIGRQASSTGAVTVSGAGSTWTNSGFIGIGEDGMGSLTMTMGGTVSNTHATVGQRGVGMALVTGMGSTWTNSSFLEVANSGTGTLTIPNGGLVSNTDGFIARQSGSEGTVVVSGTSSTWTNSGQLRVGHGGIGFLNIESGGKVTVTGGTSVSSSSQIIVDSGTFDADDNLTIDGGSLTADANAVVSFLGGTFGNGAAVSVQNGALVTHTSMLDLVSDASMQITSGSTYAPHFTRVGTLPGPPAELIVGGSGTQVLSSFAIDVGYGGNGGMSITGGAKVQSPNGAVGSFGPDSNGTVTIDGTDISGIPSSWVCGNGPNLGYHATSQGTIHVLNGGLLQSTLGMDIGDPGSASVLVNGTSASGSPSRLVTAKLVIAKSEVVVSGGARIESGPAVLTPADGDATLTVTDLGSNLVQSGASTISIGNATSGTAVVNVVNNATLTTGAGAISVNSTGQLKLDSGAVLDARGPINMQGGQFNFLGGTLHVDTFNGNLLNQGGTLAPGTVSQGNGAGTTAVSGNYTQRAAAGLDIEVGGVLPGDWDVLAIEGNASLDGSIRILLVGGFEPVVGNSFTIITTNVGNVGSQFEIENVPIFNGLSFDVVYNPKSVVLQVVVAPATADFDHDGDVDGRDFLVWQRGGTTPPLDTADLALWQSQYGSSLPLTANSNAVPEPSTSMLLSFAVVGGKLARRRRIV